MVDITWDELSEGEKISGEAVVRCTMDAYHGDLCEGPSVSRSGLHQLYSRSPAHYWGESYLNPDRIARKETDAFRLGRAAHCIILGDEEFDRCFRVAPYEKFQTEEAKGWKRAAEACGFTVLKEAELDTVYAMAEALQRDEKACRLLGERVGYRELTFVYRDPVTGVYVKVRPDVIPANAFGSDLKTTANADPVKWMWEVDAYGYDMQAALAREAFRHVLGWEMEYWGLVAIETSPPYVVQCFELDADYIAHGAVKARAALDEFAWCLKENRWPGYRGHTGARDDIAVIKPPSRLLERMREKQETGELPSYEAAGVKSS